MKTLDLEKLPVMPATAKKIRAFSYEHRADMSLQLRMFYSEVASLVEHEVRQRKAPRRRKMKELVKIAHELVYEPDAFAKRIGAASFEVQFVDKNGNPVPKNKI